MKKRGCIVFAAIFVFGLFMFAAGELKAEGSGIEHRIHLSGLIEVGGVWQDINYYNTADEPDKEDESDLCLTTVELGVEAEVNEWVNVHALFLYEDPTFGEETHVEMEEAILTIGNTEEFPVYVSAGKMFVPFGALLTHFPDDPLLHAPLTLLMGETLEKALLVGVEYEGFSVSAYAFNGDMDETGEDNNVETYGFDANFSFDDEAAFDLLVGASYISNIADSDGLEEEAGRRETYTMGGMTIDGVAVDIEVEERFHEIKEYIEGFDAYLHVGYADFFIDAEYMTALDDFEPGELGVNKAQPEVWNVEVGYNLDWGKNLEIVLKYSGSDDAECLGYPEDRYGICFNQDIFEDVIVSLGYLRDDYEDAPRDVRDEKDLVFAQIAIEF